MSVERVLGSSKTLTAIELFKPVSWMTKIDLINRLVLNNNVLITVLAENGGGKSTFFKLLQSNLDPAIVPVLIVATPLYEEAHLLAQIAAVCDVSSETEPCLKEMVAEINQRQQQVLLLIDDAQHLPMLLIESLLEVMKQQGEQGYFHVCFASEYSLVETLNRLASGAYQNMIHGLELGPLSEQELKHYITQYLPSKKNYQKVMTDTNLKEFYQLTEGQLAGINSQMTGYFDSKIAERGWYVPVSKQLASMLVAVLVLATGIVVVWQAQDIKTTDSDPMLLALAEEVQVLPEERFISEIPAFTEGANRTLSNLAQVHSKEPVQLAEHRENAAPLSKAIVSDKVAVKVKAANKPMLKPELVTQKTAATLIKPSAVVAKAALHAPSQVATEGAYTIQIIASRNQQDIQRFMKTHALPSTAKIMRSVRQGETWYVLALGSYPKRQDAVNAAQKLPTSVAQLKPWVRPVHDLHVIG